MGGYVGVGLPYVLFVYLIFMVFSILVDRREEVVESSIDYLHQSHPRKFKIL